jgi:SAM-dependent methyltransferase
LDVFGVDLAPGMVRIARAHRPDIRFDVGSMTELAVPDRSVGGVLAFFSVIHVPDEDVPAAFAHFHRVLRPGGVVLIGFHLGDRHRLKTEGYGGRPMRVHVYRRPMNRMADWARAAGLTVEAETVLLPEGDAPAGMLLARAPR